MAIQKKKAMIKKIRPHLVEFLTIGKLTPFPTTTGEIVRCDTATLNVELHCLCRVPYVPPTDEKYEMAQCKQCKEWYRRVCESGIVLFAVTDINSKKDNPFIPGGKKRSYTLKQTCSF